MCGNYPQVSFFFVQLFSIQYVRLEHFGNISTSSLKNFQTYSANPRSMQYWQLLDAMVSAHPLCSPWASFSFSRMCGTFVRTTTGLPTFSSLPLHQAEMMHFFLTAIGSDWALCAIYKSHLTSRGRHASWHQSIDLYRHCSESQTKVREVGLAQ